MIPTLSISVAAIVLAFCFEQANAQSPCPPALAPMPPGFDLHDPPKVTDLGSLAGLSSAKQDLVRRAYFEQVRQAQKKGRTFSATGASLDTLVVVEDAAPRQICLTVGAADAARELLAKARADFAARYPSHARRSAQIQAASGYRSPQRQAQLWKLEVANRYISESKVSWSAGLSRYSDAAVLQLVSYTRARQAAPGYSIHQTGKGVDFVGFDPKQGQLINTSAKPSIERWRASWLHRWLVANAPAYGFEAYAFEPWHWNYVGPE